MYLMHQHEITWTNTLNIGYQFVKFRKYTRDIWRGWAQVGRGVDSTLRPPKAAEKNQINAKTYKISDITPVSARIR